MWAIGKDRFGVFYKNTEVRAARGSGRDGREGNEAGEEGTGLGEAVRPDGPWGRGHNHLGVGWDVHANV
eukprot:2395113-Pyramimonas_sp.AAC.1